MAVLIDTSLLVDRQRGVANPDVDRAIGDDERAISVITVSELLHCVPRASRAQRVRRSAFVGMHAIEITEQTARVHADVWAQLAATGRPIGAHDLWIAATALAHGMSLATGDGNEFRRVPGLPVTGPHV